MIDFGKMKFNVRAMQINLVKKKMQILFSKDALLYF